MVSAGAVCSNTRNLLQWQHQSFKLFRMNTETKPKDSATLERWKAKRAKLDEIEISRVLEALGADPNQDRDNTKWKYDNNNIIVKNASVWFNGNQGHGGRGPIALLIHLFGWEDEDKKDTKAMNWLAEHFPEELEGEWVVAPKDDDEDDFKGFRPPERRDDTLPEVRDYLINKRGLPPSLIDREIEGGSLYGTKKFNRELREWEEAQCVFIGPSSAEVRSVLPQGLKGCCQGSNTESSGYQVLFRGPLSKTVVQTEAAVDALSHHALFPGEFVISTNGAGRFELQYKLTLEAYRNGFGSKWAYDADGAGDLAAQRIFNALFLRETLSKRFDVSADKIDEWILSKKIIAVPSESPHEMFLNDATSADHAVAQPVKVGKGEETMQLTMERRPATIVYKVLKGCEPLERGKFEETTTPEQIQDILFAYKAQRSRPEGAKDWNEVWKRKGHTAVEAYEAQFAKHAEIKPQGTAPAPVAPPVQAVAEPTTSEASNAVARPSRFARAPLRNK